MNRSRFATPLRLIAVALLATAIGPVAAFAQTPAARIGNDIITREELEWPLSPRLNDMDRQRYGVIMNRLQNVIDDRLVRQEAARQGVPIDEFLTKVFGGPDTKVTEAEVTAYITEQRATFPKNLDDQELAARARQFLEEQKQIAVRDRYLKQLRAQAGVTVFLTPPPPIRVPMNADKGFSRGAADAKVTIVEFTDFHCSYCKQASGMLRQLLAEYQGRVKLVFRDYPGTPETRTAHEAARCAGAQGKFWEYHDLLFERAPKLETEDLKVYANELKLDPVAFGECLASERFRPQVNADVLEGRKFEINGTPTFYVNGIPLIGAHPVGTFRSVIDGELAPK